ncbi:MAG TPA: hypothetical protein VJK54_01595 [Chthoniobacterales bacterium]|nr:hypothetical protein [Chthoniobacterales bacterium]
MSQLTIDLDPEAEYAIAHAAACDALPVSQWAKEKLLFAATSSSWPPGYADLLGSIDDPTFVVPEELSEKLDQQAVFS